MADRPHLTDIRVEGHCDRCDGPAEATPDGARWWHLGEHDRCAALAGDPPRFARRRRRTARRTGDLGQLPERLVDVDDALTVLAQLGPVLYEVLQPGPHARTYTRLAGGQTETAPRCDSCGGPRRWRAPTWTPGGDLTLFAAPEQLYVNAGHLNALSGVERLAAYCPRCDADATTLPPSPAPIDTAVSDVIADVDLVLADAIRRLCDARRPRWPVLADLGYRVDAVEELRALLSLGGHPTVVDRVAGELLTAARAVRAVLRDREPIVRIPARCPWCHTQALVMWPERGPTNRHNVAGIVECTYAECECEQDVCRCHRRDHTAPDGHRPHAAYRHTWTNDEWPWLSRRIDFNLYDLARGQAA